MENRIRDGMAIMFEHGPKIAALENLDDRYQGWLASYREEIIKQELFIQKVTKAQEAKYQETIKDQKDGLFKDTFG